MSVSATVRQHVQGFLGSWAVRCLEPKTSDQAVGGRCLPGYVAPLCCCQGLLTGWAALLSHLTWATRALPWHAAQSQTSTSPVPAEAAFTLLLYCELLRWEERPLREFLHYPPQTEWQRREGLCRKIIHYFNKGKVGSLGESSSPQLLL